MDELERQQTQLGLQQNELNQQSLQLQQQKEQLIRQLRDRSAQQPGGAQRWLDEWPFYEPQ